MKLSGSSNIATYIPRLSLIRLKMLQRDQTIFELKYSDCIVISLCIQPIAEKCNVMVYKRRKTFSHFCPRDPVKQCSRNILAPKLGNWVTLGYFWMPVNHTKNTISMSWKPKKMVLSAIIRHWLLLFSIRMRRQRNIPP